MIFLFGDMQLTGSVGNGGLFAERSFLLRSNERGQDCLRPLWSRREARHSQLEEGGGRRVPGQLQVHGARG